jgi:hypothetical protein
MSDFVSKATGRCQQGEVAELLPGAKRLRVDSGPRGGHFVLDASGQKVGYVVRTMPHSREIVGYSGPSDVLVVSDAADKVVGISIRHSYDTPSHVDDVKLDLLFMESWNGRGWDEIAAIKELQRGGDICGIRRHSNE